MQQSTLKKISEALNLSISTISRALKDHPDISKKTKDRVKELATALDYEPNNYAVQLRTKQSNMLAVVVPSIANFFYDSFIASVEEEARKHGYSILILQSREDTETEATCINIIRKNMISGVFASITIATEDFSPFLKLKEAKVPVIFFDRVPENWDCNKVCFADIEAARLAAMAIVQKKKKNVLALFGHPNLSITARRHDSFKETIRVHSPSAKLHVHFPEGIKESKIVALKFLKKKDRPDVIFCMGDLILLGVMSAIQQLNLKVPQDIGVVCISNGLIPTLYNPQITFVETSGHKLGKLAFSQMLGCLAKEDIQPEVFVESLLVKGGSL